MEQFKTVGSRSEPLSMMEIEESLMDVAQRFEATGAEPDGFIVLIVSAKNEDGKIHMSSMLMGNNQAVVNIIGVIDNMVEDLNV